MKNYDDLQRFKDKTRTGAIEFKDMSAQNQNLNHSHWAIIKQLSGDNEDSSLAQGGSVSLPIPQAVRPGEFDASLAKPACEQSVAPSAPQHSILDSLNTAMPAGHGVDLLQMEEHSPAVSLFEQLAPAAALTPPAVEPAPAPVQTPAAAPLRQSAAPAKAEPVRFEQLFAAKGTNTAGHPAKDLPLQPLLEMIASCR